MVRVSSRSGRVRGVGPGGVREVGKGFSLRNGGFLVGVQGGVWRGGGSGAIGREGLEESGA